MTREYPSRVLRVDLSARTVASEPVPDAWLERYVGGKGVGARYLYEELEPGTDPRSPSNVPLPDALLESRGDADGSDVGGDGERDSDANVLDPDRFDALLERYYEYRGWDAEGRPTRETLRRLGLESVADDATPVPEGDGSATHGDRDRERPTEVNDDD